MLQFRKYEFRYFCQYAYQIEVSRTWSFNAMEAQKILDRSPIALGSIPQYSIIKVAWVGDDALQVRRLQFWTESHGCVA